MVTGQIDTCIISLQIYSYHLLMRHYSGEKERDKVVAVFGFSSIMNITTHGQTESIYTVNIHQCYLKIQQFIFHLPGEIQEQNLHSTSYGNSQVIFEYLLALVI